MNNKTKFKKISYDVIEFIIHYSSFIIIKNGIKRRIKTLRTGCD